MLGLFCQIGKWLFAKIRSKNEKTARAGPRGH
jgi:hypothetical protein